MERTGGAPVPVRFEILDRMVCGTAGCMGCLLWRCARSSAAYGSQCKSLISPARPVSRDPATHMSVTIPASKFHREIGSISSITRVKGRVGDQHVFHEDERCIVCSGTGRNESYKYGAISAVYVALLRVWYTEGL